MDQPSKNTSQMRFNLTVDYRVIVLALLAVIVAMLVIWKPWAGSKTTDRTVEVTGQATLSAKPDEFVFYPTYEFKNANKQAALDELTVKNNEVIAKLKALGVPDDKIKTNSDSWSYPVFMDDTDATPTYTLRFTITVSKQDVAQKVQDYLLTTSPSGVISPQANFSDAKRKELEDKARDQASKNARTKAEQSAKNLGFTLAAVKSVNDGAGFGGGIYAMGAPSLKMEADTARPTLTIQPGQNDLTYTVTVTYFIK